MMSPWRTALLALTTGAAVSAMVWFSPLRLEATGRLSTCYWGDPVIVLNGRELPVAGWPEGMSWDWNRKAVIDARGSELVHPGDVVAIEGREVQVYGDPSPCFETREIRLDKVVAG